MRIRMNWILPGLFAFANVALGQMADPKPPAVAELPPAAAPAAQKNPDATFHAAPKPLAKDAKTTDWPCFLGPNYNLVVPETKLLKEFPPAGPRAVWAMNKGTGYAAPAVVGDRLLLFHRLGDKETLDCLKADTGERFWRHEVPVVYVDQFGYSNGPRASPVVAGGLVYTLGVTGKLTCLELTTGRVKWARELKPEFKLRGGFFGMGSTPLVEGDKLIVNVGAVPDGPCVCAFDLKTGKMVWGSGKFWGMSYASPVPATIHGKRRVLVFAGGETEFREEVIGGLLCLDPENGKVDFTFPWRGTRRESVNATTPLVFDGNKVYIGECYGAGGTVIEVTPQFQAKQLWVNETFGTHFMTPIYKDGYLYGVDGHGPVDAVLVCVDAKTGKEAWRMQPEWREPFGDRMLNLGTCRAHLMVADGQTFMLGEFGHLLRVELTPKGFTQKQRATLFFAQQTWTPPVLSRGLLYINQNEPLEREPKQGPRVICYDLRGE
jgi:outer membrane protein assembly factor BamB